MTLRISCKQSLFTGKIAAWCRYGVALQNEVQTNALPGWPIFDNKSEPDNSCADSVIMLSYTLYQIFTAKMHFLGKEKKLMFLFQFSGGLVLRGEGIPFHSSEFREICKLYSFLVWIPLLMQTVQHSSYLH